MMLGGALPVISEAQRVTNSEAKKAWYSTPEMSLLMLKDVLTMNRRIMINPRKPIKTKQ